MTRVFLSLGSNIEPRLQHIVDALTHLSQTPGISLCDVSSIYETTPVGYLKQADFLNLVCVIDTKLEPLDLLSCTQAIEKRMKRQKTVRFGPRNIDIDLLIYEGVTRRTRKLWLPHPRMDERAFVQIPLGELIGGNSWHKPSLDVRFFTKLDADMLECLKKGQKPI